MQIKVIKSSHKPTRESSSPDFFGTESRRRWNCGTKDLVNGLLRARVNKVAFDGRHRYRHNACMCVRRFLTLKSGGTAIIIRPEHSFARGIFVYLRRKEMKNEIRRD